MEEELTNEQISLKAIYDALEAFRESIEDEGCDSGYWDVRITAWNKDLVTGERFKKYEIEDETENKKGKTTVENQ